MSVIESVCFAIIICNFLSFLYLFYKEVTENHSLRMRMIRHMEIVEDALDK